MELKHFGILGMKWGVRRYQNKDGSLTPAGKKRYSQYMDYDEDRAREGYKLSEKYREMYKTVDPWYAHPHSTFDLEKVYNKVSRSGEDVARKKTRLENFPTNYNKEFSKKDVPIFQQLIANEMALAMTKTIDQLPEEQRDVGRAVAVEIIHEQLI